MAFGVGEGFWTISIFCEGLQGAFLDFGILYDRCLTRTYTHTTLPVLS
jgi:hypothetical protein